MLNGKRRTEGCCPDPEHMGIHSEERVSKTQPCCQADPGDFDLLMNCFIDLHLPLLILRMPTTMSVSSTRPPLCLFILHFMQRRGYYRMLLYVWLKSSGLSSVPPLLWRLFLSQANLYCGSLRQLSSAQWCKRTNLIPPPQSRSPPCLTPPSQAGHGPRPASFKSISQSLPGPHYHVETIMVLSGRYLLYK